MRGWRRPVPGGSRFAARLLWLVFTCAAPAGGAAVDGAVRIGTDAQSPVWVGQQITLNLEIMSTGFSFSDQQFLLPAVDGAFLLQTDSTTVKLTERRGEDTWQVLRYPIALFPQRAGSVTVPAIDVRFRASAGYGLETREFADRTQPITLRVERPPGLAGDALVVTTTRFSAEAAWSPPKSVEDVVALRAGDAVTLTVTLRAADVSGMFLPQLPVARIAGASAYPELPTVTDRVDRGRLEGSRMDRVTWVFAEPGRYELPEVRYRWFDPQTGTVGERLVPGRQFEVAAAAGSPSGAAAGPGRTPSLSWLVTGGGMTVAAAALILLAWRRIRRERLAAAVSERGLYRRALAACDHAEPAAAYAALLAWAGRRAGRSVPLGAFAATCEPGFRDEAEALQRALIGSDGGEPWDGAALAAKLRAQARRRPPTGNGGRGLVPLNPLPPRSAQTGGRRES